MGGSPIPDLAAVPLELGGHPLMGLGSSQVLSWWAPGGGACEPWLLWPLSEARGWKGLALHGAQLLKQALQPLKSSAVLHLLQSRLATCVYLCFLIFEYYYNIKLMC